MFLLEVLSGPLDGKTWTFEREISIGRDDAMVEACIPLDRYVSRHHAHLRAEGDALTLTDLESRNGTSWTARPSRAMPSSASACRSRSDARSCG